MPLVEKIEHIFEPDPLQCGQSVLAMLTGKSVVQIIRECTTERETTLKQMKNCLEKNGIKIKPERREAVEKRDLPSIALLSLETPKCWHWSLYWYGIFYDPEHGILEDFPECRRKYFWEIECF